MGGEGEGTPYFENSIIFARRGLGNGWEAGISLGIPYVSFDVRKELWEYPYITLTSGPVFYHALLGYGYGIKGNLQIGDKISLNLGSIYSRYTYEDFLSAGQYTGRDFTCQATIKFHDESGNRGGSFIIGWVYRKEYLCWGRPAFTGPLAAVCFYWYLGK